jgi:hypothetical protein
MSSRRELAMTENPHVVAGVGYGALLATLGVIAALAALLAYTAERREAVASFPGAARL